VKKPRWRDVLDSYKPHSRWWGHISKFIEATACLGYDYFIWNDRVYKYLRYEESLYETTEFTRYDIK
jgi:hypothetical protein